jgi:hypothetical protein
MIDEQASAEGCDTECLFNTPSLGQQDETLGELRAADDLDCDVLVLHRGFEPPGIGAVGGDKDDPGEERLDLAHQIDTAVTILDRPIGDQHGQEMAQTVRQDVALAAVDFLGAVIAARPEP